jgi:hypothetical protein
VRRFICAKEPLVLFCATLTPNGLRVLHSGHISTVDLLEGVGAKGSLRVIIQYCIKIIDGIWDFSLTIIF